jgi:hypothetical protein
VTARTKWTLAIVGLLVANIIAMAVLVVSSSSQPPRIAPGYEAR